MNKFIAKCDNCNDYKRKVDMKFFEHEKVLETYSDGKTQISEAPARWYCKECIKNWGNAYDGWTYEEWGATRPISTVNLLQ